MDNYESKYIVLRPILGSCLSDINKSMPLWYYGILLPKEKDDCSISFMLNYKISETKQILESSGLINIKDNNIKFVIDTSGHRDNCSWSMFRLETSFLINYFAKISITRLISIKGI